MSATAASNGGGEAFEEVVETFALLDDWEERYRYLIELGRALPPLDETERTAATKVEGCVSQVWMVGEEDAAGALHLRGDSDAHIVRGLIALLLKLYDGRPPRQILDTDAREALARLDLEGHLSPSRSNGLFAMVRRIKALAAAAEARG